MTRLANEGARDRMSSRGSFDAGDGALGRVGANRNRAVGILHLSESKREEEK